MEWQEKGADVSLVTLGKKAAAFFKNVNVEIMGHVSGLGEKPQIEDLIGAVRIMLEAYRDNEIQRLYIVANEFVNTMTQNPVIEQMLPLPPTMMKKSGTSGTTSTSRMPRHCWMRYLCVISKA